MKSGFATPCKPSGPNPLSWAPPARAKMQRGATACAHAHTGTRTRTRTRLFGFGAGAVSHRTSAASLRNCAASHRTSAVSHSNNAVSHRNSAVLNTTRVPTWVHVGTRGCPGRSPGYTGSAARWLTQLATLYEHCMNTVCTLYDCMNTQVEYMECCKVVDTAGNTSGDLCGVPGLLHAIGLALH